MRKMKSSRSERSVAVVVEGLEDRRLLSSTALSFSGGAGGISDTGFTGTLGNGAIGANLAMVRLVDEFERVTYGELDASASNCVYVCHALTGDSHAAGPGGVSRHRHHARGLDGRGQALRPRPGAGVRPGRVGQGVEPAAPGAALSLTVTARSFSLARLITSS